MFWLQDEFHGGAADPARCLTEDGDKLQKTGGGTGKTGGRWDAPNSSLKESEQRVGDILKEELQDDWPVMKSHPSTLIWEVTWHDDGREDANKPESDLSAAELHCG